VVDVVAVAIIIFLAVDVVHVHVVVGQKFIWEAQWGVKSVAPKLIWTVIVKICCRWSLSFILTPSTWMGFRN